MPLSDDFLQAIALDFNSEQPRGGATILPALLATVESQQYRRIFRNVQETGLPDGVTNTSVIVRLRPKTVAWMVRVVSWNNGQAGSGAELIMSTDRKDPDVPNSFIHQGRATIASASNEVVVGPMSFTMATVTNNERPFEIFVPAAAELRFELRKVGGGILEGGAQTLQMFIEEMPPERSYARFRAQTVLVT